MLIATGGLDPAGEPTVSAAVAVETTLVLVKPDGMQRRLAGEIVTRLERRGLDLRGARLLKISRPLAAQHYAERP